MKTKLNVWMLILLVLLVAITEMATFISDKSVSQIEVKEKQCVREEGESIRGANYEPGQNGWSERIWGRRRKRRPYRNPFRRYRIGKKQRRQLRRRLTRMAEIADELSNFGEKVSSGCPTERMPLSETSNVTARWG
jgi:ribosomal protein S4